MLEAAVITRAIGVLDNRSQCKKALEAMINITSHLFGEGTRSFPGLFSFLKGWGQKN